MKIPKEYQDRYTWPKWLRIVQAVLLVANALCVIGAVATATFAVSHIANLAWVAFFGYCTYQNVKTTNEIKAELAEISVEDTRKE
jgi:hypothetical protein